MPALFPASTSIAIVGMACEFPGAHSPEELWQNVLAGRRFFRKAPPERMPPEYFDADPHATDKAYCDRMAVLTGWEFDPLRFRIPPVTARASDIAHWLALHTADLALKDSGLDLAAFDRSRAGIMLGNTLAGEFARAHNLRLRWPYAARALRRSLHAQGLAEEIIRPILQAYRQHFEAPFPEASEDTLAGNMSNTIAGRVCNHFDFGGGGFAVDGACSSSLLGVVLACDALVRGDLDLALAGGVDVSLDPFEIVGFAKTQALTRSDIHPYDERAGGMLTGEGCGLVVLMREADARARGLRIHALLKGWAYSSDGKGGMTAPEVDGQVRALTRAYQRAGYPMSSVGYIEGHGTGTPVGDKIELTAIQRVLLSDAGEVHCSIGSIKANIGHCKAAAGAAGLIKAIQALQRKILPPTLNCERPTGVFAQSGWKLRPSVQGRAWESNGAPRRASVSSMGFGGANSHVTLEEVNPERQAEPADLALLGSAQSSELLLLAAASLPELRAKIEKLIPIVAGLCQAELTDLAAALAGQKPTGTYRLGIVTAAPWELADSLRMLVRRISEGAGLPDLDAPEAGIFAGTALTNPSFVALFPGQGAQRLNMGGRLSERFPFVRQFLGQVDQRITDHTYRDPLGASPVQLQEWESQLKATHIAQPAIVAASVATLQVLEFLGLRPALAVGHSLGEITALHAAGAFDALSAVRIALLRGEAMRSLPASDAGSMLAIAARPEEVLPLLAPFGDTLAISGYNSPTQTVVSGTTESIGGLHRSCQAGNIRCRQLPVSHAFHSDIVAPAAIAFRASLETVACGRLSGRVISTSTGGEVAGDADLKDLLARQIRRPVQFVDAVQRAAKIKPAMWIEVGPGGVLSGFVREIVGVDSVHCLPTDLAGEDAFHLLNRVVARAFVCGFPVATEKLFAHRFHRSFDPENHRPIVIVNPCERVVEITPPVEPLSLALPARLAPAGVSDRQLAGYLADRGDFLREFIALDMRHNSGVAPLPTGARFIAPAPEEASLPLPLPQPSPSPIPEPPRAAALDRESLLTFAINWIAKRTGFPKSTIGPEKRLRDDLNLDSIKVGELVVLMSQELKRPLKGDPASFANATLHQLIDGLLGDSGIQTGHVVSSDTRQIDFQSVKSLGEWVRTFRVVPAVAPISGEPHQPLPASGKVVVVGEAGSPRTRALAEALREKGLTPLISDAESLTRTPPPVGDLAALIVLLPSVETDFVECTPAQFDARVEGFASFLFHAFRWALAASPALRALVVRPSSDASATAADLDAGAAFLKSLQLETVNASLKWLVLPEGWAAEKWAATAVQELECSGRGSVRYSPRGERTVEEAIPVTATRGGSLVMNATETVAVPDELEEALTRWIAELTRFQAACSQDPAHPGSNPRFASFGRGLFAALDKFEHLTKAMAPADRLLQQQRVYAALKPFVAGTAAFRRILEKPLGYPGDHLLMEIICANSIETQGIGYHFDRYFLSHPGSEAVRQRTKWTVGKLESLLSRKAKPSVLDLGCGPMVIERMLAARLVNGQRCDVLGVDYDDKALSHARSHLANGRINVRTKHLNLVSPEGIEQLGILSKSSDACICMGLIEYLQDETVVLILRTIHEACRPGTLVLLANFKPDHFSRRAMEWLQDWWLVYRTEADLHRLARAAGFAEGEIRLSLDETESLVLIELEKGIST